MQDYSGKPIDTQEAWLMFDRWKASHQRIGIIFWGRSGNLYAMGTIESANSNRLALIGDSTRASFNLIGVSFKYGPMQTWPRWPSPPIVEVNALRAEFENGDYLALAEGLTPPPIDLPALPGSRSTRAI